MSMIEELKKSLLENKAEADNEKLNAMMTSIVDFIVAYDDKADKVDKPEPLHEVIYEAKNLLVDHIKKHPSEIDSFVDVPLVSKFLNDPIDALQQHYDKLEGIMRNNNKEDTKEFKRISEMPRILHDCKKDYEELEKAKGEKWKPYIEGRKNTLLSKLDKKLGMPLAQVLSNNKGGWWERHMDWTSPEYKELVNTLGYFDNNKLLDYGNLKSLEVAAKVYLVHKLPGYTDTEKEPDYSTMGKASTTGQRRIQFCKTLLETIAEVRKEELVADVHKGNQEEFQNDINNEVDLNKVVNVDNELVNDSPNVEMVEVKQ